MACRDQKLAQTEASDEEEANPADNRPDSAREN